MTDKQIITGQYVRIEQTPASTTRRLTAFFIDMLVQGAYVLFTLISLENMHANPSTAFILLFIILPTLIYQPVCESLAGGKTLGKHLVGTRVVNVDGSQPSVGAFILRWLLMPVDVLFFGAVAAFTMLITPRRQRLGDLAAGTMVIRLNSYDKIRVHLDEYNYVRDGYRPTFKEARLLTEEQAQRIARTLADRSTSRRHRIELLACELRSSLQLPTQTYLSFEQFLTTLLSDYRFFEIENAT